MQGFVKVFFILVLLIMILSIIRNIANKKKKPVNHMLKKKPKPEKIERQQKEDSAKRAYRMLEDRENDWLARQRREEAANERRFSAMYGLKRLHEANCPARDIREEHRGNCDAAGVDTGTAR